MTVIQYLSAFRLYGADVLLIATGVSLCTSLLKKTALKNCAKKIYVFLPFAFGIAFYAVYRAAVLRSAEPFTSGLARTLEGGFACGCAATLYYVIYEQFFRNRGKEPPVAELLAGIVPAEKIGEAAKTLTEGGAQLAGEELIRFVTETLERFADPPLSKAELALYTVTVAEFLETTR
ncbi:MAG: hypothetical protein K2H43_07210 [Clostridia bacterium]|nr:hypothetical protein [Clostridia bacterium]